MVSNGKITMILTHLFDSNDTSLESKWYAINDKRFSNTINLMIEIFQGMFPPDQTYFVEKNALTLPFFGEARIFSRKN